MIFAKKKGMNIRIILRLSVADIVERLSQKTLGKKSKMKKNLKEKDGMSLAKINRVYFEKDKQLWSMTASQALIMIQRILMGQDYDLDHYGKRIYRRPINAKIHEAFSYYDYYWNEIKDQIMRRG